MQNVKLKFPVRRFPEASRIFTYVPRADWMNKIIIDGYNVIFRTPELRKLAKQNLEEARDEFIRLVKNYVSVKQVFVTIIFDGTEPPLGVDDERYGKRLLVTFSRNPFKADPLIKENIRKSSNPKAITLVTDDLDIVRFAKNKHTRVMTTTEFFQLLHKRHQDIAQDYSKEPELTEDELAEWLRLFDAGDSKK